ncbi:lytic polysaccharide monooxygenase [Plenodomus tracheiphilus IPT5]|uniref:AA9 family lytic polysaccharide monooxygenase n=1 Tax=Plenodomus tracheiphilus IPT5 TaxID=1408161 RepID=A0A6A7BKI0_9PLEO|nr:lytic polysaccharide monooxygenase [Plenodomus tracheiphilus IPT5]
MKTPAILLAALASAPAALAHTVFTDFYVDGQPQGDGVAMRMSPYPDTAGSPIASLDSDDMACNVGGTKGASRVQPVKDGSLLTFEIRSWANDPSKERLDRGHKGPCAVYLKKVDSAVDDKATGDGWFKLFDHGYNSATDRWCTDEIIDNNGLLSVNLPKGLEGGYYLARPEILALHAANSGDPQFYTGCAQIFLQSSGNLVPESTVSIPGYVKYGQPATDFDIYNTDNAKYTVPGPAVAKLTPRGTQTGNDAQLAQTEGLKPSGCLVENANWCGEEVSSYTTEKGCWASAEECWTQSKKCYDTSPPTGNAGCELWQTKCKGIQTQCSAGNFDGPPNKGKVLTPQKAAIDVGEIMQTVGGGVVDEPSPKTSEKAKTTSAAAAPKPTPNDTYKNKPAYNNNNKAVEQSDKKDDNNKQASPAPAPAKSSTYDAPAYTLTVAPSADGAPAPTPAPECPEGWKCVTVTQVDVVTKTVYVTAADEGYGGEHKRSALRRRRHAHRV